MVILMKQEFDFDLYLSLFLSLFNTVKIQCVTFDAFI